MTYEEWETKTGRRHDRQGLVEHFCEHGIGHPNPGSALWIAELNEASVALSEDISVEDARQRVFDAFEAEMVHGCDGCCGEPTFPDFRDSLMRAHAIIRTQNAALRAHNTAS